MPIEQSTMSLQAQNGVKKKSSKIQVELQKEPEVNETVIVMPIEQSTVSLQALNDVPKKSSKIQVELQKETEVNETVIVMSIEQSTMSLQALNGVKKKKSSKIQVKHLKEPEVNEPKPTLKNEKKSAEEVPLSLSKDAAGKIGCRSKHVDRDWTTANGKRKDSKSSKHDSSLENKKITDYYQIRRSSRCTEAELKKKKQNDLEECVRAGRQDGLEIINFEGKGRGVVATRPFCRGEFVVEYVGELIDLSLAKEREQKYASEEKGCYIYYFTFKDKNYCIDATEETGRFGRLVNHSCKNFNCVTKPIEVDGNPRLILVASRLVNAGEEMLYDYGDRNAESLKAHPWLAL